MRERHNHGWLQFSLRSLLALITIVGFMLWADPWGWRSPWLAPIETVTPGQTNRVELIEITTQQQGTKPWRQVVFWSRYPDGELHVRDWRMIGTKRMSDFKVEQRGRIWDCTWIEEGTARRIQAVSFRESDTPGIDGEIADRAAVPKETRVPLWGSP